MHKKYLKFDKKININNIFNCLEKFIDLRDLDISFQIYFHGFESAQK